MPRWAVPASGLGLAAAIAVVGVFGLFWFRAAPPETVATGSMLPTVTKSKVQEVIIPAIPNESLLAKAPVPVPAPATASAEPKGNGEPMSYVTPPASRQALTTRALRWQVTWARTPQSRRRCCGTRR